MHERSRQSFYLRFLCLKRAVCSGVWEFAADFRFAIPEVRGKTEIWRPDPGFTLQRPAVLFAKIGLWSGVAYFSPHFRNMGILAAIQVPYNAMQQGATLKIYFARSRFSLSSSRSTRELDALSSGMANVLGTIPTSDTVKSSFLTILLTIMVSKMVRIWVE